MFEQIEQDVPILGGCYFPGPLKKPSCFRIPGESLDLGGNLVRKLQKFKRIGLEGLSDRADGLGAGQIPGLAVLDLREIAEIDSDRVR